MNASQPGAAKSKNAFLAEAQRQQFSCWLFRLGEDTSPYLKP
jgi:hypothetical protein